MSNETDQGTSYSEMRGESDDESDTEEGLFNISRKQYLLVFYLFLSVWLVYMFVKIQQFTHPADTLIPTIMFVLGASLITAKLITIQYPTVVERVMPNKAGARATVESKMSDDESSQRMKKERERIELLMALWILPLPLFMYFIGLGWAILLYSFAFSLYFIKDWRTAIINTVIIVGLAYVLFVEVLGILLWEGHLPMIRDLFFYIEQIF